MAESLEFDLKVKNNDLDKALDSGTKKALNLEGVLETALGVFSGNLATKAFDSLIGGFDSLISVANEAIDAAAAQEVATNNLNNALARNGNFTKKASDDLLEFASALQRTTVFEDDAVIANTALLQSLTKLGTEGLKQGVSAAADFATVLGIDLETATRLVAKAAEGNTEAFKRYGVEIKKGTSDSENFANTVEALNKQFGGASQAQLNTYSGSLKALNNAYGDLLEPVGDIIVKNPLVIAAFNEIKNIINDTNTSVSGSVPVFQELINDGFFALAAATQVLFDAFDGIGRVVQVLVGTFQNLSGIIGQTLIAPFELLIDSVIFLGSKIPGLGSAFEDLKNPLDGATEAMARLTQEGINTIASAADGNVFTDLSNGVETFTNKLIESSASVKIAQAESVKNNKDRKINEDETNAEILAARAQLGIDIKTIQAQAAAEEQALNEQLNALRLEGELASNTAKIEAIFAQKIAEAQATYEGELLKNKAIQDATQQNLANEKSFETLRLASLKAQSQKELAIKGEQIKSEQALNKEREQNQKDTLSTIATLSQSGNKTLAAIGKAAALTQIAIDGPQAVTKALAAFPPPFNFAAAAAVGTAVAAQAARVAGVAFANGGFIDGNNGATMGPDTTTAQVRSGEMVLNANQQKQLFDAINNGGIGSRGDIIVQVDGREIARAVRSQVQSGFVLA